jgi:hypothetical protein
LNRNSLSLPKKKLWEEEVRDVLDCPNDDEDESILSGGGKGTNFSLSSIFLLTNVSNTFTNSQVGCIDNGTATNSLTLDRNLNLTHGLYVRKCAVGIGGV